MLMRRADASGRILGVAHGHLPPVERHVWQVVLEDRRTRRGRRRAGRRLSLRIERAARNEQFGKECERGNCLTTTDHHVVLPTRPTCPTHLTCPTRPTCRTHP